MTITRDPGRTATLSSRQCRRLAQRLPLPQPWSVEQLCAEVAASRGRPLEIFDHRMTRDSVTAATLATDTTDYISWRADLRGLHRDHAICHELGHLLAGHTGAFEFVTPSLGPGTVAFHRDCDYSAAQERQAEMMADIIMGRVVQHLTPPESSARSVLRGFDDALR